MPSSRPAVHLISADLPLLACRLVAAERARLAERPPAVLDLSGEAWLAQLQALHPDAGLTSFEALPYGLQLWIQLQPRLEPWLQLLELQELEPLLAPPLPGVEMVLRCLCLAEAYERNPDLTVLLPAPAEATALLELARTGPSLVEGLLEPLLLWWDQIRQSLSSLELVLRLRLPSSAGLRLDDTWRRRLERLAEALGPDGGWQFTVALDQGDPAAELLRCRLIGMAFRGCVPSRLGLHGPGAAALLAAPPDWLPSALPVLALEPSADEEALVSLLALASLEPPTPSGPDRIILPLPGLLKSELDVQQIGSVLVLRSQGHRRLVPLPAALEGKLCSGARLEGGWLELRFG